MIIFKSRCYNGGPKHKFESCYNQEKEEPSLDGFHCHGYDYYELSRIIELIRRVKTTYIRSVCKWCGKVV